MTEEQFNEKVEKIQTDEKCSTEDKQRRIGVVTEAYNNAQQQAADAAAAKQKQADDALKATLRENYLKSAAATEADFERDYATLRSEYLRAQALKENGSLYSVRASF